VLGRAKAARRCKTLTERAARELQSLSKVLVGFHNGKIFHRTRCPKLCKCACVGNTTKSLFLLSDLRAGVSFWMPRFCVSRTPSVCRGSTRSYRNAPSDNRSYWIPTTAGLVCLRCYKHDLNQRRDGNQQRTNDRESVLRRTAATIHDSKLRERVLTVAVAQNRRFFWNRYSWTFALLTFDWETLCHRDGFKGIWSIWRFWAHIIAYDEFDHICLLARVWYVSARSR
jgi:hypothetical protein